MAQKKASAKVLSGKKKARPKFQFADLPPKDLSLMDLQLADLLKEQWPQERDVLFRPDRLKYVRKMIKDEGCVFCRSAKEKLAFKTLCVFKSKHSQIVINKFPYNSGHVLVLPLRHCGDLLDLSSTEYKDLMKTLRLAMKAVQKVYDPNGINLGMNHGKVSGAGIPDHLHFHLVPRWAGDLNFFPLIAETKVVVESLETTYNRLLAFFKKSR